VKEGRCDRCETPVVRKSIRQWILKITAYADRLLSDLDTLDWSESIKLMQRNWIGRSEGANVVFKMAGGDGEIEVYTTRPDTLFGATYMVLAPEHALVARITTPDRKSAVDAYVAEAARKSDLERTDLAKDKTGEFTGAYAVNPVNGREIPVWISDYILASYGTGAIMAVPAHDERDWDFAKEFGLPIIQVVAAQGSDQARAGEITGEPAECTSAEGVAINSGKFDGLPTAEAIKAITEWLALEGIGRKAVNYKLRDWIFSRQRYWGEPIPVVHCKDCGIVPLPESELPLKLPDVKTYVPTGTGESPLANIHDWVNTTCPKCGGPAKRETNTMPQWAGSCWYYLRFIDPKNDTAFAAKDKIEYWMPVDLYVGGAEHAVLHLLYSRFWHKVLYDIGAVNTIEPFQRLVNQGMILGEDNQKMSKSRGNVVNPDDIVRDFGADAMRVYEMFMGPLEVSKPWATAGLVGVNRFLERIWTLSEKPHSASEPSPELAKLLHKTIKKVTDDTATLNFNTAISAMMILSNELSRLDTLPRAVWETFIRLLAPYAAHLAEELWEKAGKKPSVGLALWPGYDEALVRDDTAVIVVQVNGKVRDKFDAPAGTAQAELERLALSREKTREWTAGKKIRKVIIVPDKLVNIVVGEG